MFRLLAAVIVKLWPQMFNTAKKFHSDTIQYANFTGRTPSVLQMKM